MDLNNMGAGKKLIEEIIKDGNVKTMGWSKTQQENLINRQKNSKTRSR